MFRVFKDRLGRWVFRSPVSRVCDWDFNKLLEKVTKNWRGSNRWQVVEAFDKAAKKYMLA